MPVDHSGNTPPAAFFNEDQSDLCHHPLLQKPVNANLFNFDIDFDLEQRGLPLVPPSSTPMQQNQWNHHVYAASMPEQSNSFSSFSALEQRQAAELYATPPSTNPYFMTQQYSNGHPPSPPSDDMTFLLNQLSQSQPANQSHFFGSHSNVNQHPFFNHPHESPSTPPFISRSQTPKNRVVVRVNSPSVDQQLPKGKYLDGGVLINHRSSRPSTGATSNSYLSSSPDIRIRTRGSDNYLGGQAFGGSRRGSEPYIIQRRPTVHQPTSPNNNPLMQQDSPSFIQKSPQQMITSPDQNFLPFEF